MPVMSAQAVSRSWDEGGVYVLYLYPVAARVVVS